MSRQVVLVHGAWHGAWCWDRLLPHLDKADVEAVAIDLPGHGEDPGPLGDLHADSGRVTEVLDRSDGGVLLVGHSYGGAVITEAGVHPAVEHLLYLAAFPLDEGETCMTAAAQIAEAAGIDHAGRPDLSGALQDRGDGNLIIEPAAAAATLYNTCDEETVAWAVARLGPQPAVTLAQEASAVAWRTKASTYAICTEDLIVHPDFQRIVAGRCTSSVEWATDHSPFLCRPDLVARLISDLV